MTAISVHSSSDAFRFGTQSLLVTTGDSGDNAIYPDGDIAVDAGSPVTLSAYIFTPTPLAGGGVKIVLCPAGSLVPFAESDIVADTSDAPDGWHRLILTGTVPDGIFSVRPAIVYTGTTAGQQFFLDGVKFEPGAVASEWEANIVSAGTVLDQKGMIIDATQSSVFRLAGSGGGARDQVTLGVHGLIFGGDTEVYSPSTGELSIGGAPVGGVPTGVIAAYGGATAPTGWMLCDGAAVSRTTYSALFAAIGIAYGAGDGSSTFNLPDLRQRFLLGVAASGTGSALGSSGGAIDHAHAGPSHTHTGPSHTHASAAHSHGLSSAGWAQVSVNTTGVQTNTVTGVASWTRNRAVEWSSPSTPSGSTFTEGIALDGATDSATPGSTGAGGTGATGAGGTANTGAQNPPYLTANYIIKT